jgi:hypothetical protein
VPADPLPPELLLDGYPPPIRDLADVLRNVVRCAVPEAVERVRVGWRLVGYDVPLGCATRFFAFVTPEPRHVHLGFENGMLLDDPDEVLLGRGITKKARWFTFRPGDEVARALLAPFVREAAAIARMTREERYARQMTQSEVDEHP